MREFELIDLSRVLDKLRLALEYRSRIEVLQEQIYDLVYSGDCEKKFEHYKYIERCYSKIDYELLGDIEEIEDFLKIMEEQYDIANQKELERRKKIEGERNREREVRRILNAPYSSPQKDFYDKTGH